ncbi:MAG TPA: tetratricopeptide repeat protein [Gammaproteobacteria bacterium]|nr:tetratricopeptide repeat protein [Gammaproteobacteria bacterium]
MVDEIYASEQEQVEAIKKWLKENGGAIVVGVVLGLGAVGGWRWWQTRVRVEAEAASAVFEQALGASFNGKADEAEKIAGSVITDHPRTTYAAYSALLLARLAVEKHDLAAAKTQLEWVLANSSGSGVRTTAQIRLARVLLAEGKPDEAWKQVEKIDPTAGGTALLAIKGDILAAQGKTAEARQQYLDLQARTGAAADADNDPWSLKLDNLNAAPAKKSQ